MDIIIYLKRRLEHDTMIASTCEAYNNSPSSDLTVHAGHDVFYWRGRQSALEDMLDYLGELDNNHSE